MTSELTPHQSVAFEQILKDIRKNLLTFDRTLELDERILSLTGAAGTGKSFLTTKVVQTINDDLNTANYHYNFGIALTAPTHKAVEVLKNLSDTQDIDVQALTIHSFLNIKPIYDYEIGEESFTVLRTKTPSVASLLIVDESSMISAKIFDYICESLERGYINTVLFIGDPYQLLPVNDTDNKIFKVRKQYKLTEIVRQAKDSPIIKLATKIRLGIEKKEYRDLKVLIKENLSKDIILFDKKRIFVEDFYSNENWHEDDKIIASFANDDVDTFNAAVRTQFWNERGVDKPDLFLPNEMIRFRKAFNLDIAAAKISISYRNSEEVMLKDVEFIYIKELNIYVWKCTVYDREKKDFFRVVDPGSMLNFNKYLDTYIHKAKVSKYPYNRIYWKRYFKIKEAFADVQYTFAATIHKLQGSTFDEIYIDIDSLANNKFISNDLKYRLAYVAITRARNKIKIF